MSQYEKQHLFINTHPWPDFMRGSYRHFNENEKHVTRICREYVLLFMLERELHFTEDSRDVMVGSGEWYIQIPGLLQEGKKGSPAPVYYYIHFITEGELSSENGPDSSEGKCRIPISGNFDPHIFKHFFNHLDEYQKCFPPNAMGQQSVFLTILSHLTAITPSFESSQRLILRVMDYLAENYARAVTGKELTFKFHFSSDYITRKMNQYYGITPWQYVQRIRIFKAKELLANTDNTMADISNELGYNDLSVFYKAFKKQTEVAPGVWRQRVRNI